MEDIKAMGRRLCNWGRWGADDRLGTLNHITPERLVAAARLVRTGKLFDLGLPLGADGIQIGLVGRINPVHTMSMTPHDSCTHDLGLRPEGMIVADDVIYMPLQCATRWDGLAHAGYEASSTTVSPDAACCSTSRDSGASSRWRRARRSSSTI